MRWLTIAFLLLPACGGAPVPQGVVHWSIDNQGFPQHVVVSIMPDGARWSDPPVVSAGACEGL